MDEKYSRRDLLKQGGALGAGLALANTGILAAKAAERASTAKPLGIGFVGVGARGSCLLKILLELDGVQIRALCDIREDRVTRAQRWVTEAGQSHVRGLGFGCGVSP